MFKDRFALIVGCFLLISLFASACDGSNSTQPTRLAEGSETLESEGVPEGPERAETSESVSLTDFKSLQTAYHERDRALYASRLRAALYVAHRLTPEICLIQQSHLLDYGEEHGFDGLESLWLIYQDCAAFSQNFETSIIRLNNAQKLKEVIHFVNDPAANLPELLSSWNSSIERTVRSEALRTLTELTAASIPEETSHLDLAHLLSLDKTTAVLCNIAPRNNQFGEIAITEVVRQAECFTGLGSDLSMLCDNAEQAQEAEFPNDTGNPEIDGFSEMEPESVNRLTSLCDSLAQGGGSVGLDALDNFSESFCMSERPSTVPDSARIVALIEECHSAESNPIASGTAGIGSTHKELIEWEYPTGHRGAWISFPAPEWNHPDSYVGGHGVGNTPQEAREGMYNHLRSQGFDVEVTGNGGGSQTVQIMGESIVTNEDGSTNTIVHDARINIGPDGNVQSSSSKDVKHDSDGTFLSQTDKNTNADGSSRSHNVEVAPDGSQVTTVRETDSNGNSTTTETSTDSDGNVKKSTVTTTDKDGNGTTSTTTYDDDGEPATTTQSAGASTPGTEGGNFDPRKPACQELLRKGLVNGQRDSIFWNYLFERERWEDPRLINPDPETLTPGLENGEPFCNELTTEQGSGAHCQSLMMCAEGHYLDENCECKRNEGAGSIILGGCLGAYCAEGTTPVPVGMNQCSCVGGESGDEPMPQPPIPADLELVVGFSNEFADLYWNQSVETPFGLEPNVLSDPDPGS